MSNHFDLRKTLRALAQGGRVDWDRFAGQPTPTSPLLDGLRLISKIAEVHADQNGTTAVVDDDPERWGSFVLRERVGRGAYGTVYRAFDERLAREVALKLFPADDEAPDDTLVQEAGLLARIHHPNVVTVYGADRHDGRLGIWMEFVHGRTIDALVRTRGPMQAADIMRVGAQIAGGVQGIHDAGIVHRDINAQNVIVQEDGRAVVMDFGAGVSRERVHAGTTGTPLYIAPEVLEGGGATPSSDVYSIGILLYFMATAGFPVGGDTLAELRASHDAGHRLPVGERQRDLPELLRKAIERASDPNPDIRFPSAAALEAALVAPQSAIRWPGVIALVVLMFLGAVVAFMPAARARQSAIANGTGSAAGDPLESVVVHSPTAARHYKESLHYGRRGEWNAAIEPATLAVKEDPSFASGWIWLAWSVRNATLGGLPYPYADNVRLGAERRYGPYVTRALALAPTVPEWEQHWIAGTAALFADDDEAALTHMGAVFAATHLDYALNNLTNTTTRIFLRARVPEEAARRITQAKLLIPPDTWSRCCEWSEWSPSYVAWRMNRIDYVTARVDQALRDSQSGAQPPAAPAPYFALAVGRLTDASILMKALTRVRSGPYMVLPLMTIAEARQDEAEIERLAASMARGGDMMRPSRLLRAGFVRDAADMLNSRQPATPYAQALFDVARGQMLARQGRVTEAIPLLRDGRYALTNTAYPEYYEGCAALAQAYVQTGATPNAIDELKTCTDREPSITAGDGQMWYGVWHWLSLRQDLAELYRSSGRASDADAIELVLKSRLARGDRDVPLVRRVLDAAVGQSH